MLNQGFRVTLRLEYRLKKGGRRKPMLTTEKLSDLIGNCTSYGPVFLYRYNHFINYGGTLSFDIDCSVFSEHEDYFKWIKSDYEVKDPSNILELIKWIMDNVKEDDYYIALEEYDNGDLVNIREVIGKLWNMEISSISGIPVLKYGSNINLEQSKLVKFFASVLKRKKVNRFKLTTINEGVIIYDLDNSTPDEIKFYPIGLPKYIMKTCFVTIHKESGHFKRLNNPANLPYVGQVEASVQSIIDTIKETYGRDTVFTWSDEDEHITSCLKLIPEVSKGEKPNIYCIIGEE